MHLGRISMKEPVNSLLQKLKNVRSRGQINVDYLSTSTLVIIMIMIMCGILKIKSIKTTKLERYQKSRENIFNENGFSFVRLKNYATEN
jgi:hypothetical protein